MEFGDIIDIRKVAALLNNGSAYSSLDDEVDCNGVKAIGPGGIGGDSNSNGLSTPSKQVNRNLSKEVHAKPSKDVWSSNEIPSVGNQCRDEIFVPDVSSDPRIHPTVDIQYKQEVGAEDVFLGIGSNILPGTSGCSWIILKISLPGELDHNSFQLDLKDKWIELRTQKYILVETLPHRINPRLGNAKWDKQSATLTLNLKIIRELDLSGNY